MCHLSPGSWPAASQTIGETGGELLAPAPHRLVGDSDTAFRQDQLDIAQAEAERMVQRDSVADDLGREPMTVVWVWWWHRVPVSPASAAAAKPDYETMPDQVILDGWCGIVTS